MNKKAQTMGLAIINTIAIFLIGFMFINFLMPEVTDFRVNLNCSDASNIHDGNKLLCLMGDATVPYFILLIFSLGLGIIMSRLGI